MMAKRVQQSDEALELLVAESDLGARHPSGYSAIVLVAVPIIWSLFQLWYASPLPFIFNFVVLNDTEARAIHLAFAIFLAYTAYPTFKTSPRHYIPLHDWITAFVAAFCASYLFVFYEELANRPGLPTSFDLAVSITG
ncbi:MAG: C4-dicarboxylate ABC transporter, partial [Gammaproteobacteria bacterium]|nr:C4-dicarboxylate ABC transporter [Gammaproteobacteria bacterium]